MWYDVDIIIWLGLTRKFEVALARVTHVSGVCSKQSQFLLYLDGQPYVNKLILCRVKVITWIREVNVGGVYCIQLFSVEMSNKLVRIG